MNTRGQVPQARIPPGRLGTAFLAALAGAMPLGAQGPPGVPGPAAAGRPVDPPPPGAIARFGWVRLHHGAWVKGLAFSPDGGVLASCGGQYNQPGDVSLWNVAAGRLVRSLPGPPLGQTAVTFSPDGRTLVAAGQDRSLRVWDVATGTPSNRLKLGSFRGTWVEFSPDGALLGISDSSSLSVVDVRTGQAVLKVDRASYCAFSRDGKLLAVTSMRDTKVGAQLWDLTGRKLLRSMSGENQRLTVPSLSPDGSVLAAGSMYGTDRDTVLLWDTKTGSVLRKLMGQGSYVYWTTFSPDGRRLASASRTGSVRVWNVLTGQVEKDLPCGADRIETVAFSPNGKLLAAGGYLGQIRLWDVPDFTERLTETGHRGPVAAADASADGRVVATAGQDGTFRLWDGRSGAQLRRLPVPGGSLTSAAVSPDGRLAATCGGRGAVQIWDTGTGELLRSAGTGLEASLWVAFLPGGEGLLALGPNGAVSEIDPATADVQPLQAGGKTSYSKLAVSCDLETAASFDRSQIYAWELRTGRSIGAFGVADVPYFYGIDVSPGGRLLAGDAGQKIVLVEVDSGNVVRQIGIPGRRVGQGQMAFSPDGAVLAVSEATGGITFWSVRSGQKLAERNGHRGYVTAMKFLPGGKAMLTASSDSTAILWDLRGPKGPVPAGVADPNSRQLEQSWEDLASTDAAKAHEAAFRMVAGGDRAVAVLGKRLQSVGASISDQTRRLIDELGDSSYAVRERATDSLARLGSAAEPALKRAEAESPSEEVRARARALLEPMVDPPRRKGDFLRQLRALRVLEQLGTARARALLGALAAGEPRATLTIRAAAARRRLQRAAPAPAEGAQGR